MYLMTQRRRFTHRLTGANIVLTPEFFKQLDEYIVEQPSSEIPAVDSYLLDEAKTSADIGGTYEVVLNDGSHAWKIRCDSNRGTYEILYVGLL